MALLFVLAIGGPAAARGGRCAHSSYQTAAVPADRGSTGTCPEHAERHATALGCVAYFRLNARVFWTRRKADDHRP